MKGKWQLLAFLCGIFLVYTVDRSMLGILAIPIQKETGLSDTAFGVLNAGIFWAYAASRMASRSAAACSCWARLRSRSRFSSRFVTTR